MRLLSCLQCNGMLQKCVQESEGSKFPSHPGWTQLPKLSTSPSLSLHSSSSSPPESPWPSPTCQKKSRSRRSRKEEGSPSNLQKTFTNRSEGGAGPGPGGGSSESSECDTSDPRQLSSSSSSSSSSCHHHVTVGSYEQIVSASIRSSRDSFLPSLTVLCVQNSLSGRYDASSSVSRWCIHVYRSRCAYRLCTYTSMFLCHSLSLSLALSPSSSRCVLDRDKR